MTTRIKITQKFRSLALISGFLCLFLTLSACFWENLWEDDLYAVNMGDSPEDVALYRKVGERSLSFRIFQTVVAVSSNEQYVAVYVDRTGFDGDGYYLLNKALDSYTADPEDSVTGPFNETEFRAFQRRYAIPDLVELD